MWRLSWFLAIAALCAGCPEQASRTQRIPQSGQCQQADLYKAGDPGEACGIAEDCSAYCCTCVGGHEIEAQLCLGGTCADAATTCDDVLTAAPGCGG
jgi:hypothetical protein